MGARSNDGGCAFGLAKERTLRFLSYPWFLVAALFASTTAGALECDHSLPVSAEQIAARGSGDSNLLDCSVSGITGFSLSTTIDSSLTHARGFLSVRFVDSAGRSLWTWKSEPFIGQFSGFNFQKVIAVPHGAARARVLLGTEGGRNDSGGKLAVDIRAVASGVVVQLEPKSLAVFTEASVGEWVITAAPGTPGFSLQVEARDLDGHSAYSGTWKTVAGSSLTYQLPKLPVGYYTLVARAQVAGFASLSLSKNFSVVAAGNVPQEPRIGLDAALSWYGGTAGDIEHASALMRLAGVGSVRDRLRWFQVQPQSGAAQWGRYKVVAEQLARGGFELVTTFHDSPPWSRRISGTNSGDRFPPLEIQAVRNFGRLFAKDMGQKVRAVEFWNEQNSAFFSGYPYQYANAMKAFYEGIKSVDPSMSVLIGSSAARPGPFFEESYSNGLSTYFDLRNQHYYGPADEFPNFMATHVAPLERLGGVESKPGWLTEIGYSLRRDDQGGLERAEREQAIYLTKAYAEGFAAGYERVFFFFLRELIEDDFHNWGILRSDFSPRPAYSALAALSRHIAGRQLAAVRRSGSARAVFWRGLDGSYSAIAWGSGSAREFLGTFKSAQDVFGRPVSFTADDFSLSDSPLLLNGISKLPAGSSAVKLPSASKGYVSRLRISADVTVDGKDVASKLGNRAGLPIRDDAELVISGHVFVPRGSGADGKASISLFCQPGPGVKAEGTVAHALEGDGESGVPFRCVFRPRLVDLGRGFVRVTAKSKGLTDTMQLALDADLASLGASAARSLHKALVCGAWQGRASRNITLTTQSILIPGQPCPGVKVESSVEKSGEAWVFPARSLAISAINGKGMRIDVNAIAGKDFPPVPLMLQIVDASGGIWLLEMHRKTEVEGIASYSGLFSMAKPAPWRAPKDSALNPAQAKEIMFGWGGVAGQKGQRHGYVIRSVSVIDPSSAEANAE